MSSQKMLEWIKMIYDESEMERWIYPKILCDSVLNNHIFLSIHKNYHWNINKMVEIFLEIVELFEDLELFTMKESNFKYNIESIMFLSYNLKFIMQIIKPRLSII